MIGRYSNVVYTIVYFDVEMIRTVVFCKIYYFSKLFSINKLFHLKYNFKISNQRNEELLD